jgi:5S rRNA maturation endonuclease (ribonuclease M5)
MADDIVEQIKARLRIEDVIEQDGYPLPKRGSYRKCTTPDLGGLIVNVNKQMYYWNSRAEWGDLIGWVEKRRGLDFKGAVEELAQRAGLPAPEWRGEDQAQRAAARAREEALDVAQRVFVRWFWKSEDARAYARGRGWTDDQAATAEDGQTEPEPGTLRLAMLGYSGDGSQGEREEMRKELELSGVDLDSPAAVSILGYRGNVHEWAKRHGIQLNDDWLANGYIPGMVGRKRLVYAHVRGGRVRYLSGRGIEQKFHYNLPDALVGKRQVYFNQAYSPSAEEVIIVEGQADAISLGQLGVAAVALAGVSPDEDIAEELKHHKAVYVGLDADTAGEKNRWRVADVLGPLARLVRWDSMQEYRRWGTDSAPVKDANDLLRAMIGAALPEDGQTAAVRGMLADAVTYVEGICAWAGGLRGAERDDGLVQALKVVNRLSKMQFSTYRSAVAKLMGIGTRELDNMLKALQQEEKMEKARGEPVYTWGGMVDGWLIEYLYDQDEDQASLAWRDPQGRIGSGDSVNIEGRCYMPSPPNETLKSGAVNFPSALGDRKSLAELLTYIKMYTASIYILPSDETAGLIAYWVLSTWVYDCFETVIYLRAMGGAGSGKSELIKRIGLISYRTMTANGAGSTSSLFRSLERYKGVVLLDEADLQQSDTENDMIKFYNLGAMRGNPIWRTIETTGPNGEKDWEAVSFQTFCPKLIAMRKDFKDDAVGTRSLTLKLNPREMTELRAAGVPLTINQEIRARAQALRNLLCRWRLETWQPEIPVDFDLYDMTISPRLNQVAGPLLAIARDDQAQQEEIRHTLREYYAETIIGQSMTIGARVLEAMWKIYQYPDLRKAMKIEADGAELLKVGDVTRIANDLINEMNDTGDDDADDNNKRKQELSSQRIGRIIRSDLQLKVSERRRDGFWVYWNGPRMEGLTTRYGINPADFKPVVKENGSGPVTAQQGTML